jgi:hypothetical protein
MDVALGATPVLIAAVALAATAVPAARRSWTELSAWLRRQ